MSSTFRQQDDIIIKKQITVISAGIDKYLGQYKTLAGDVNQSSIFYADGLSC